MIRLSFLGCGAFLMVSSARASEPQLEWLDRFLALARDPATLDAPPAQVQRIFGLRSGRKLLSCYSELALSDDHPSFITDGFAHLTGPGDDCDAFRIGIVELVVVDQADFVASALERGTAAFGMSPSERRDAAPNIVYHWQIGRLTAVELTVFDFNADRGHYGLTLAHVPGR